MSVVFQTKKNNAIWITKSNSVSKEVFNYIIKSFLERTISNTNSKSLLLIEMPLRSNESYVQRKYYIFSVEVLVLGLIRAGTGRCSNTYSLWIYCIEEKDEKWILILAPDCSDSNIANQYEWRGLILEGVDVFLCIHSYSYRLVRTHFILKIRMRLVLFLWAGDWR